MIDALPRASALRRAATSTAEGGLDGSGPAARGRPDRIRVFYLATSPDLFGPICLQPAAPPAWSRRDARVVLEKPIGHDLDSATRDQRRRRARCSARRRSSASTIISARRRSRTCWRCASPTSLFEPLWNADHDRPRPDHRRRDRRRRGARRLLRQGRRAARHGAEPHAAAAVPGRHGAAGSHGRRRGARREAEGAARRCSPIATREVAAQSPCAASTRAGAVDGSAVPGYLPRSSARDQPHRDLRRAQGRDRTTGAGPACPSTCAPASACRSGCREIVIQFRAVPHSIFPAATPARSTPNRLVIRLQPDEGIAARADDQGPGARRPAAAPRTARHHASPRPSRCATPTPTSGC